MGNDCFKKKQNINETVVNDSGTLSKSCGEKELNFWMDMEKLKLVKISKFNKAKRIVEFNYSDLFIENFISFSQIMDYLITDQNFLYFIPIFEITIALIDFIQVIFTLKKKYQINKNDFFFINFEKFYLMKESDGERGSFYSRLVYLDEKLNDVYSCAEILYKEDSNNMLSSFSIIEDQNGKSMQMLLSNISSNHINYKATTSMDLNSFFYSKCNEKFQVLKNNYSLEKCEKFYTENIITFISRFLLKKVVMPSGEMEHDFGNLKYLLRHTLSHFFKTQEKITLQNLKMLLTNFYLNNFEFNVIREHIEEKILNTDGYNDNLHMDKVVSFQQTGICLNYGDCDVVSDDKSIQHRIVFINDYLNNGELNINKEHICIKCASNVISKKAPEGRSTSLSLIKFEEEILKKHSFVDLIVFLKYMCIYFESNENTKLIMDERGDEIQVYRRNKTCVTFEFIHWDDYKEEVLINEVLNLDFNIKNQVSKSKKLASDKSLILPTGAEINNSIAKLSKK